jgi:hypothetical protein
MFASVFIAAPKKSDHAKCFITTRLLTDGKQLISVIPEADSDSRDVDGPIDHARVRTLHETPVTGGADTAGKNEDPDTYAQALSDMKRYAAIPHPAGSIRSTRGLRGARAT